MLLWQQFLLWGEKMYQTVFAFILICLPNNCLMSWPLPLKLALPVSTHKVSITKPTPRFIWQMWRMNPKPTPVYSRSWQTHQSFLMGSFWWGWKCGTASGWRWGWEEQVRGLQRRRSSDSPSRVRTDDMVLKKNITCWWKHIQPSFLFYFIFYHYSPLQSR